jgi:tetratricopeptide (TPR) repeat protein
VESNPSAEERHRERRWLYGWRAARAEDPTEVLLEWAHAELEYGDPEAARTAYEQVLALHPAHTRALDEVYHLRFQAGDFDGGVAALEKLREQAGDEGPALTLRVAEWLWRELGRPGEAAQVLAAVLADEPSRVSPRELGRKMLGDPTARPEVIERFEAIANRAPAAAARQILEFLVAAREETGDLHELRRRWLERIVELSANAPETALSHAIQGVLEAPDALALWDAAEAAARQLGRPELVAQAYHRVFLEHAIPPALAAVLGPRMVAFEEACSLDSAASVEALLRVLEAAPEARWALDRV